MCVCGSRSAKSFNHQVNHPATNVCNLIDVSRHFGWIIAHEQTQRATHKMNQKYIYRISICVWLTGKCIGQYLRKTVNQTWNRIPILIIYLSLNFCFILREKNFYKCASCLMYFSRANLTNFTSQHSTAIHYIKYARTKQYTNKR